MLQHYVQFHSDQLRSVSKKSPWGFAFCRPCDGQAMSRPCKTCPAGHPSAWTHKHTADDHHTKQAMSRPCKTCPAGHPSAWTHKHTAEVCCPAWRMLVNAREWRNNASQVALPTLLLVTKARSNTRGAGRSLAFKTRWQMCFSNFRTSRSRSFVFMQTFSLFLLLADKTRTAVKVIYLLISVQSIFFHALWMVMFLSFYFSQQ